MEVSTMATSPDILTSGEFSAPQLHADQVEDLLRLHKAAQKISRLQEHLQQPDVSAQSILADVRRFANGAGLHDDATLIFLKA
jgi:hypothetical protein